MENEGSTMGCVTEWEVKIFLHEKTLKTDKEVGDLNSTSICKKRCLEPHPISLYFETIDTENNVYF